MQSVRCFAENESLHLKNKAIDPFRSDKKVLSKMKQEKFDRLPRYAQTRIRELEFEIANLKNKLKESLEREGVLAGKTPSAISHGHDVLSNARVRYIPSNEDVHFQFNDSSKIIVGLRKYGGHDCLIVNGDIKGSIATIPQASNCFLVIRTERV